MSKYYQVLKKMISVPKNKENILKRNLLFVENGEFTRQDWFTSVTKLSLKLGEELAHEFQKTKKFNPLIANLNTNIAEARKEAHKLTHMRKLLGLKLYDELMSEGPEKAFEMFLNRYETHFGKRELGIEDLILWIEFLVKQNPVVEMLDMLRVAATKAPHFNREKFPKFMEENSEEIIAALQKNFKEDADVLYLQLKGFSNHFFKKGLKSTERYLNGKDIILTDEHILFAINLRDNSPYRIAKVSPTERLF